MSKRITIDDLVLFLKENMSFFDNNKEIITINDINTNKDNDFLKSLPKNLLNFFNNSKIVFNSFKNIEVINFIDDKLDISLITSLIRCFDKSYNKYKDNNKKIIKFATDYKLKLYTDMIKNKFSSFNIKEILEDLKNGNNTNLLIYLLGEYMCLNIFILDINDDKIFYCGNHKKYKLTKESIILIRFKDKSINPLKINGSLIFNYNSDIIIYLNKNLYGYDFINNKYVKDIKIQNDNILSIIERLNKLKNIDKYNNFREIS